MKGMGPSQKKDRQPEVKPVEDLCEGYFGKNEFLKMGKSQKEAKKIEKMSEEKD